MKREKYASLYDLDFTYDMPEAWEPTKADPEPEVIEQEELDTGFRVYKLCDKDGNVVTTADDSSDEKGYDYTEDEMWVKHHGHNGELLNEFLSRLLEDAEKLFSLGYSEKNVLYMLETMPYVYVYMHNPQFMYLIKSLPKGHKWSDPEVMTYGQKGVYKCMFYPIGDNLYISERGNQTYKGCIENYRMIRPQTLSLDLHGLHAELDIVSVYKELGLNISMTNQDMPELVNDRERKD